MLYATKKINFNNKKCGVSTINSDKTKMRKFAIVPAVLIAMAITTNGQIPNSGFENWTTVGSYENPTGWATMNAVSTGPFYSCTKSTDHFPASVGNYSLRLENNTSLTQQTGGFGIAVTNAFDHPFKPAFPIIGHPTRLCGYFKYNALNNDTMFVKVVFFNNGIMVYNQDTIATNTPTWTPFSMTFPSYTSADSATIIISAFYANGPTDVPNGNSVLYIDNLSFNNFITSVPESTFKNPLFSLYPNPAADIVTLNIDGTSSADITLNIYNVLGALVKTEMLFHNQQQIDISDLKNGIYIFEIKSKELTGKHKLIIER